MEEESVYNKLKINRYLRNYGSDETCLYSGLLKSTTTDRREFYGIQITNGISILKELGPNKEPKYFYILNFFKQKTYNRIDKLNNFIMNYFEFKIKSVEDSINLFGYSNVKNYLKKASDEQDISYTLTSIKEDHPCSKDGVSRHVITIEVNGKNLKFLLSDLEIVFPDLVKITKGYNKPLDRKVLLGKTVKIIKKNKAGLQYGERVYVSNMLTAGNKKYCEIKSLQTDKKYIIEKNKLKIIKC